MMQYSFGEEENVEDHSLETPTLRGVCSCGQYKNAGNIGKEREVHVSEGGAF